MLFTSKRITLALLLFPLALNSFALPDELGFHDGLVINQVSRYQRTLLHRDLIEDRIIHDQWTPPKAGDTIQTTTDVSREWKPIKADENGVFQSRELMNAYVEIQIESDREEIRLLQASGHDLVYVNGEPHAGDPYSTGYSLIPVQIQKGNNEFLFSCRRGRLQAKLLEPKADVQLNPGDMTLPDLFTGGNVDTWGSIIVINNRNETEKNLYLSLETTPYTVQFTPIDPILPRGVKKAAFHIAGIPLQTTDMLNLELRLYRKQNEEWTLLDKTPLTLAVKQPSETHKRAFPSQIDGSIQYFGVVPQKYPAIQLRPNLDGFNPYYAGSAHSALFLSLHGASVEAIGQAQAYAAKGWGTVVCPTNRRPYGFDWEDWGRMDALEVLDQARRFYSADPSRIYLTGHSMGGHGTWQIGAHFPDRFAAIAPSAGWISFRSYTGGAEEPSDNPMEEILFRSSAASDTLALATNYVQQGIYILHGDADDNVPVSEARNMKAYLDKFHPHVEYHEQPGAGHWWDDDEEPGASCVDWPPMFDLFAHRTIPALSAIREITFTTINPGISSKCHWLAILQQEEAMKPSTVELRLDPHLCRITGKTSNIHTLALFPSLMSEGNTLEVTLDGTEPYKYSYSGQEPLIFSKEDETWRLVPQENHEKSPQRYGPFKEAFNHRFVFVYGTQGSPDENQAILNKVRLDSETFWYRGNGSMEIVADTEFDAEKYADRNVILYGNAASNSCWKTLLSDDQVSVEPGLVRIGERKLIGDDLACLFIQPKRDNEKNLIAAVSATGAAGMRLTERLPYFISGVGFPDCLVMNSESITKGIEGVKAAGFFGLDWSVENGEFVYQ